MLIMFLDSFCERCRVKTETDNRKYCKKCSFPK